MKDPKLAKIAREIELRYPGTRVEVEPFRGPEGGRSLRWLMSVFWVRSRYLDTLDDFVDALARSLYGRKVLPFLLAPVDMRGTRQHLADKKAERASARRWAARGARLRRQMRERRRIRRRKASWTLRRSGNR
jgi:hypothetical protein